MADEETPIIFQSGTTSSKKWKKSNFIFLGGIMGLVVFILIIFSILRNMDEISKLQGKLEFEGEHVKFLESQLKLEIETRKQENATLSEAIQAIRNFLSDSDNKTTFIDGPYGVNRGSPWYDGLLSNNEDITAISAIEIKSGEVFHAIRVRYVLT